ncbi:MAG: hypothetical protein ACJATC_001220 [Neptuniibacter pectenicola]|jgi:hypothetical protein
MAEVMYVLTIGQCYGEMSKVLDDGDLIIKHGTFS